jgi:hypothetical protein
MAADCEMLLLLLGRARRIVDHLRRRFAGFKSATGRTRCGELCAYFLQASSKRFDCCPTAEAICTCCMYVKSARHAAKLD